MIPKSRFTRYVSRKWPFLIAVLTLLVCPLVPWTAMFFFSVLAALVVAKAFGLKGGPPWLTADYAAGAVIGVGLGLTLSGFLTTWFEAEPMQLSCSGIVVATVGSLARFMAKRAASRNFATH